MPPVTHFAIIDAILAGHWYVIDAVAHLILPSIALGSIPLAVITRITRASVIDVSNEDYVRTARAKGLTERRVNDRHIMRNAWLPVTTVIGLQVGGAPRGRRADRDRLHLERRGLVGRQLHPEPRLHRRPVAGS